MEAPPEVLPAPPDGLVEPVATTAPPAAAVARGSPRATGGAHRPSDPALDHKLLHDRPRIGGDPVHEHARREPDHDQDEHERHEQHDLPLRLVHRRALHDKARRELAADVQHQEHDERGSLGVIRQVADEEESRAVVRPTWNGRARAHTTLLIPLTRWWGWTALQMSTRRSWRNM